MSKILLATTNPHKVEKLTWIVQGYFTDIESLRDHPISLDLNEDGKTFQENAEKKAVEYSKHYAGYTIATDGGVRIPALGNQWNSLYTRRFAGEGATDQERIEQLLSMMADKDNQERLMQWQEAIAIARDGKLLFSHETVGAKGILQKTYDMTKYKPGIWVCSVWYFPQVGKNFFDMTPKEQEYVEISWHKLREKTRTFLAQLGQPTNA